MVAYNGGQKNLGLCEEKALPRNCYVGLLFMTIFLMGFGFIVLWPKKALIFTHFAQNSTLFEVRGEGSLVLLFIWKGPNTFDLH